MFVKNIKVYFCVGNTGVKLALEPKKCNMLSFIDIFNIKVLEVEFIVKNLADTYIVA